MKKTRYFHIAYDVQHNNGGRSIGSLTCSREYFITKKDIDNEAMKELGVIKSLVVTSIFEFKNEADFKSFIS